jgi:hypothetical protein
VYKVLIAFTPEGPPLTVTLTTLEAGVTEPVPEPPEFELEPPLRESPPPPQEVNARQRSKAPPSNAQPRNAEVGTGLT